MIFFMRSNGLIRQEMQRKISPFVPLITKSDIIKIIFIVIAIPTIVLKS